MKNFRIVKTVVLSAAAVSCMPMLTGCFETKVNLNDYLTVDFSGYDTIGIATAKFDYEKMITENPSAFGLEANPSDMDIAAVMLDLDGVINGKLSKAEKLSNGDSISYEWEVNMTDALSDQFNVKFDYETVNIDIKELEEAELFDPFASINVTFGGIAPNGTVTIDGSVEGISGLYFEADKKTGLKNGDVVTVSLTTSRGDVQTYCTQYGKIPSAVEKEYTVEGLSAYAAKIDEIPEDMQNKMLSQAEDSFQAYATGWASGNTLEKAEFIGYYFLTPKEGFNTSYKNEIYCVYKMTTNITGYTAENTEEQQTGTEEYYTYFHYGNIMLLDDGTCSVDLSDGYMCRETVDSKYGSLWFWSSSVNPYEYKGYNDLDSMFSDCVTKQIANCNYESTVK